MVKVISSQTLETNLDRLGNKINNGFFNILLIFGATRSGKSTLGVQISHYLSKKIGVSFNNDDIFFDVEKLVKECQLGKRKKIYMLDEAAFDLLGEDWQNKFQKMLIKIFMVAAKYNQTFVILIPRLEKLREFFVTNEHTRAIQVYYNKKTLERGFFKAYSDTNLYLLYDAYKQKKFWKLKDINCDFKGRFNKKMSYIDLNKYQYAKDKAIKALGNDNNKDKTLEILKKVLDCVKTKHKIAITSISRDIGKNATYLSKITSE